MIFDTAADRVVRRSMEGIQARTRRRFGRRALEDEFGPPEPPKRPELVPLLTTLDFKGITEAARGGTAPMRRFPALDTTPLLPLDSPQRRMFDFQQGDLQPGTEPWFQAQLYGRALTPTEEVEAGLRKPAGVKEIIGRVREADTAAGQIFAAPITGKGMPWAGPEGYQYPGSSIVNILAEEAFRPTSGAAMAAPIVGGESLLARLAANAAIQGGANVTQDVALGRTSPEELAFSAGVGATLGAGLPESGGVARATGRFLRGRGGASAVGAGIGATQGDTPQERLRNAGIGAGLGLFGADVAVRGGLLDDLSKAVVRSRFAPEAGSLTRPATMADVGTYVRHQLRFVAGLSDDQADAVAGDATRAVKAVADGDESKLIDGFEGLDGRPLTAGEVVDELNLRELVGYERVSRGESGMLGPNGREMNPVDPYAQFADDDITDPGLRAEVDEVLEGPTMGIFEAVNDYTDASASFRFAARGDAPGPNTAANESLVANYQAMARKGLAELERRAADGDSDARTAIEELRGALIKADEPRAQLSTKELAQKVYNRADDDPTALLVREELRRRAYNGDKEAINFLVDEGEDLPSGLTGFRRRFGGERGALGVSSGLPPSSRLPSRRADRDWVVPTDRKYTEVQPEWATGWRRLEYKVGGYAVKFSHAQGLKEFTADVDTPVRISVGFDRVGDGVGKPSEIKEVARLLWDMQRLNPDAELYAVPASDRLASVYRRLGFDPEGRTGGQTLLFNARKFRDAVGVRERGALGRKGIGEEYEGERFGAAAHDPFPNDTPQERMGFPDPVKKAPTKAAALKALNKIRDQVKADALAGEASRPWYKLGSQAFARSFGLQGINPFAENADVIAREAIAANPEAAALTDMMLQVVAITSPKRTPEQNLDHAFRAYFEWKTTGKVKGGGGSGISTTQAKKIQAVFDGQPWDGRKTDAFYMAHLRFIDPDKWQAYIDQSGGAPVVDRWILRAYGYGSAAQEKVSKAEADTVGKRQFKVISDEIHRLADELGWDYDEVQAAMWAGVKQRLGKNAAERSATDYAEALRKMSVYVSSESLPSLHIRTSGGRPILDGIQDAPREVQEAFARDVDAVFKDEAGNDIVMSFYDMPLFDQFAGPVGRQGTTTPTGLQQLIPVAQDLGGGAARKIDEEADPRLNLVAATLAYAKGRDSVGVTKHFPLPQKPPKGVGKANFDKMHNSAIVDIGRPITQEEAAALDRALTETFGAKAYYTVNMRTGFSVQLHGAPDGHTAEGFQKQIEAVVKANLGGDGVADAFVVGYNGRLASENDWGRYPNGEGHLEALRVGDAGGHRQVLQRLELADRLRRDVEAVWQAYAERHGWAYEAPEVRTQAKGSRLGDFLGGERGSLGRRRDFNLLSEQGDFLEPPPTRNAIAAAFRAAREGRFSTPRPEEFAAALRRNKAAASLSQYTPDELAGMRLYKLENAEVYFALKPTEQGLELVGVMNNSADLPGIATPAVMLKAIEEGADTLDAFDVRGFLPKRYGRFGFEEYDRVSYDLEAYGPPTDTLKAAWATQGWREGDPLPDVVFMRYNGPARDQVRAQYVGSGGLRGRDTQARVAPATRGAAAGPGQEPGIYPQHQGQVARTGAIGPQRTTFPGQQPVVQGLSERPAARPFGGGDDEIGAQLARDTKLNERAFGQTEPPDLPAPISLQTAQRYLPERQQFLKQITTMQEQKDAVSVRLQALRKAYADQTARRRAVGAAKRKGASAVPQGLVSKNQIVQAEKQLRKARLELARAKKLMNEADVRVSVDDIGQRMLDAGVPMERVMAFRSGYKQAVEFSQASRDYIDAPPWRRFLANADAFLEGKVPSGVVSEISRAHAVLGSAMNKISDEWIATWSPRIEEALSREGDRLKYVGPAKFRGLANEYRSQAIVSHPEWWSGKSGDLQLVLDELQKFQRQHYDMLRELDPKAAPPVDMPYLRTMWDIPESDLVAAMARPSGRVSISKARAWHDPFVAMTQKSWPYKLKQTSVGELIEAAAKQADRQIAMMTERRLILRKYGTKEPMNKASGYVKFRNPYYAGWAAKAEIVNFIDQLHEPAPTAVRQVGNVGSLVRNTIFGVGDIGIFGQHVLQLSAFKGPLMLGAAVNRSLELMHLPHFATYLTDDFSRAAQRELDGLPQGVVGAVADPRPQTLVGLIPHAGPKVDQALDKLQYAQFAGVLQPLRNMAYEGNLIVAKLLGQDITSPVVRRAAAENALAFSGGSLGALTRSRRGYEKTFLGAPQITRSMFSQLGQVAKIARPDTVEGQLALVTLASMAATVYGIGSAINMSFGSGDPVPFDPRDVKWATIHVGGKWETVNGRPRYTGGRQVSLIPQRTLVRSLGKSAVALEQMAQGDSDGYTRLMTTWGQFAFTRSHPLMQDPLTAGLGTGFTKDGYFRPGGLSAGERISSIIPQPIVARQVMEGEVRTPLDAASAVFGVSSFPGQTAEEINKVEDKQARKTLEQKLEAEGFVRPERGFQSPAWRKVFADAGVRDVQKYGSLEELRKAYVEYWGPRFQKEYGVSDNLGKNYAERAFSQLQAVKAFNKAVAQAELQFWAEHPDLLMEALDSGSEKISADKYKILLESGLVGQPAR